MKMIKDLPLYLCDRIYILGDNPNGILPIAADWNKVGRSNPTSGKGKSFLDWTERTRALNQGNPRGVKIHYEYYFAESIRYFESKTLPLLFRKHDIKCLQDIDRQRGHTEWCNAYPDELNKLIMGSINDNFSSMLTIDPGTGSQIKIYYRDLSKNSPLFQSQGKITGFNIHLYRN